MPEADDDKEKGPFWYNEIPPRVFFNAKNISEDKLQLLQQKWQKEILDEQLDAQQRAVLRVQRAARVYLNPPPFYNKPRTDPRTMQDTKEHRRYQHEEREKLHILGRRKQNETCAIYGVNYRDVGGQSERRTVGSVLSARGLVCQTVRRFPPFHGPHALQMLPFETAPGKPVRERFQIKIFRDKIHGHQLLKRESKDVHQYKTTPLAIWRQHRFASPDGCQFTDLKEQVQAAKYKAMLKVQEMKKDDRVAIGYAKLTSHFKPWTGRADDNPDCQDYLHDKAMRERAQKDLAKKASKVNSARSAAMKAAFLATEQARKAREEARGERERRSHQSSLNSRTSQAGTTKRSSHVRSGHPGGQTNRSSQVNSSSRSSRVSYPASQRRAGGSQGGFRGLQNGLSDGSEGGMSEDEDDGTELRMVKAEPGGRKKLMRVPRRRKASSVATSSLEGSMFSGSSSAKKEEERLSAEDTKLEQTAKSPSKMRNEAGNETEKEAKKEGGKEEEKEGVADGKTKAGHKKAQADLSAPDFSVEEDYLEDLHTLNVTIRKQLKEAISPQPAGKFYQDPRTNPKYIECFKQGKSDTFLKGPPKEPKGTRRIDKTKRPSK